MKKNILFLLAFLPVLLFSISLTSCSKDDDDEPESGLMVMSKSELESTPSFVYSHTSSVSYKYSYELYVWFREGKMHIFKNGATNSSSYVRTYDYTLKGQSLTISSGTTSYRGYLSKFVSGSKKQLVISQGLDGTNIGNLPEDYLQWYDYSYVDLSK